MPHAMLPTGARPAGATALLWLLQVMPCALLQLMLMSALLLLLVAQQVLGLPAPERFPALLPVSSFDEQDATLVMATSAGGIKRTPLAAFSSIQRNGLAAIKLPEVGT